MPKESWFTAAKAWNERPALREAEAFMEDLGRSANLVADRAPRVSNAIAGFAAFWTSSDGVAARALLAAHGRWLHLGDAVSWSDGTVHRYYLGSDGFERGDIDPFEIHRAKDAVRAFLEQLHKPRAKVACREVVDDLVRHGGFEPSFFLLVILAKLDAVADVLLKSGEKHNP